MGGIVREAFEQRISSRLPKGELWIGKDLLKKANLENNLKGHIELIKSLHQDILCLPLLDGISTRQDLGYRRFSLKELKEASRAKDFFLATVIDGPFQRLSEKRGLMQILMGWKREKHEFAKAYEIEGAEVDILIERCLEQSVDAIVIADDLAGERSLFVDPHEIQDIFSSFYIRSISKIHRGGSYTLFHSCGHIRGLIPQLLGFGFDGLAAIEHRTNDLIGLKEEYGLNLILMAGIDAELLGTGPLSMSGLKEYERILKLLVPQGGFILCSSSGLFSGEFIEKIQELYRVAEKLFSD
jgi:hypothetical protein